MRDHCTEDAVRGHLKDIQDRLFAMGSNLATPPGKLLPVPPANEADIAELEQAMDRMDEVLPELKHFILPGGHVAVSHCHLARVVCRRAARRIVELAQNEAVDETLVRYLNRLSDYFFVLARFLGHQLGVAEIIWSARTKK